MHHFKDLPKRLSALLKQKGWTQKDLHRHSGVAASQISEYLNSKNPRYPTLLILSKLLEALDASPEDLFAPSAPRPEPGSVESRLGALEEQHSYFEAQLSGLDLDVDRRLDAVDRSLEDIRAQLDRTRDERQVN